MYERQANTDKTISKKQDRSGGNCFAYFFLPLFAPNLGCTFGIQESKIGEKQAKKTLTEWVLITLSACPRSHGTIRLRVSQAVVPVRVLVLILLRTVLHNNNIMIYVYVYEVHVLLLYRYTRSTSTSYEYVVRVLVLPGIKKQKVEVGALRYQYKIIMTSTWV